MDVKLVVFDVDGVLVKEYSSWEYLHRYFNAKKLAGQVYGMRKQGRIDYYDWMYLDTMLWGHAAGRGYVTRKEIMEALEKVGLNQEMIKIANQLAREKKKIVLLSGGIDLLVQKIANKTKADCWISNILVFDRDDKLVPGGIPIVPPGSKGIHMRLLMNEYRVNRENTVFIGDSIWDKEAFLEAGLSIFFGHNEDNEQLGACVKTHDPRQVLELIRKYENNDLDCR